MSGGPRRRRRPRRGWWTSGGWSDLIGRLSIRGKLVLLLALPLASAALAAGPFVAVLAVDAAAAGRTAAAADDSRAVAVLMGELQAERLLLSAFLASPGDDGSAVDRQQRTVDDTAERVRGELGSDISDELAAALVRIGSLQQVRDIAAGRGVSPDRVARSYHAAIEALVEALPLISREESGDAQGTRQLTALDALLRADEFAELRGAALVAAAVDPDSGLPILADAEAQAGLFVERFVQQADTDLAGLVVGVVEGRSALQAAELVGRLPDPADVVAVETFAGGAVQIVGELAVARQAAREQVTALIAAAAVDRAATARDTAWAISIGAALLILAVAVLSVQVSRSIATPLRRLTDGARDVTDLVADLAERELATVADSDQAAALRVPRPVEIQVGSHDELGRLTANFNRMQATAVNLIERQILTRQNVSLMFANVAQRTQNLVGRQLVLVDRMERDEQDERLLANLYQLDHLSTRLRRNADNLLVVAGVRDEIGTRGPTDLSTALRSALAQIEDFKRVQIGDPPDRRFAASVGADLVLVFAELLDNATSFSPPSTVVEVGMITGDDGSCEVTIVDHGIGMPAGRLAEENARLVGRERVDVAPTTVLGLFVVGRICRRHALAVELVPTAGGGVTARVTIEARLFLSDLDPARSPDGSAAAVGPTAIPPVIIPSARDSGPFTWFADDGVTDGRPTAGAGGFAARQSPPDRVASTARDALPRSEPSGSAGAGGRTETRGGLHRRVAGAQLPGSVASRSVDPGPVRRQPHHDPAAARHGYGELEAGFGRATGATPRAGEQPVGQRSGLTRRVPGVSMAPELRSHRARPATGGGPVPRWVRDPAGERAQFDAFEAAVTRSARQEPTRETRP